jgi:hypothetical protein
MSNTGNTVLYVYGIVRDGFDAKGSPAGIDATAVEVRNGGKVGALLSLLSAKDYAPDVIEEKSGDVGWLSPRATAHDRVLTWAQERGGVIPLPMFSLWGTDDALAETLASRSAEFAKVFKRVAGADEFGVRVHRRDDVMLKAVDELDPDMAKLRREAEAASPGQRYLLERKFAEQSKAAIRAASLRMAKRVFEELAALSRDALARPVTPPAAGAAPADATMVLNGAFLVERDKLESFRKALGELVRELQPHGLTFDFTGPWPPYNFASEAS